MRWLEAVRRACVDDEGSERLWVAMLALGLALAAVAWGAGE